MRNYQVIARVNGLAAGSEMPLTDEQAAPLLADGFIGPAIGEEIHDAIAAEITEATEATESVPASAKKTARNK